MLCSKRWSESKEDEVIIRGTFGYELAMEDDAAVARGGAVKKMGGGSRG